MVLFDDARDLRSWTLEHMSIVLEGILSREYPTFLRTIVKRGYGLESRVGRTREVLDLSLRLHHPEWCVVSRPGFSRGFMEVEIAQLLGGKYDQEGLARYAPLAGDLITPDTAYGPRIKHQLRLVRDELKKPGSRRAILFIGNTTDLAATHYSLARNEEMPCTISIQFLLRDRRLHGIVGMRSWDMVWGLSYDVPSFVAVQKALARDLGCDIGQMTVHAGSAHVYERHWDLEASSSRDGFLEIPWLEDTIEGTQIAASRRVRGWDEQL